MMEVGPVVDRKAWDAAVAASGGHLLQSWAWGELKSLFGWSSLRLAVSDAGRTVAGAQVLFRRLGPVSLAYVPRGPWGDLRDVAVVRLLLGAVHDAARRRRAIFLKLEPPLTDEPTNLEWVAALGFRPSAQRVQPVSTIVVDLTADLATISARLKPKWRYNIGLAQRRGVTVRAAGLADVPAWYRLMQITGRRDGFPLHPEAYYRQFLSLLGPAARLLLAEHQGVLLAGIAVTAFGPQAIYMYGASGDEHRNLMPNHLLQWEAIRWAKDAGCREYDLWGIPDEVGQAGGAEPSAGPIDGSESELAGVYRFKAGFGGQVVRMVGAWDYAYSEPMYWLYRTALPWYRRLRLRGQG